jgi:hypothetical protein
MHLDFGTPFAKRLRISDLRKETSFQEPYRNKLVMGERKLCPEVVTGRQAAAEKQAALVKSRISSGNSGLWPCKGSYYVQKQERHLQMKLREAVRGAVPGHYTHNQVSP